MAFDHLLHELAAGGALFKILAKVRVQDLVESPEGDRVAVGFDLDQAPGKVHELKCLPECTGRIVRYPVTVLCDLQ